MLYIKPATTVEDQITQLQSRGLQIKHVGFAKQVLKNISYYRLAGYWWPLQADKTNHTFKQNSNFETVVKLYNFDRELRILLFDVIEKIEISLRTKLVYHLSQEYTPWWFEDPTLFIDQNDFTDHMNTIKREVNQSKKKEAFLIEHYKKYNTDTRLPPAWKTMEVLSFGTLSKMYGNLVNSSKSKNIIAVEFGTANHTYLQSWLQSVSQIRNICAHHGRLWNKNLPGRPKLLSKPPFDWLKIVPPASEHSMLYIHLCCMKYLLNTIFEGNHFTYRLYHILTKYSNVDLKALGMPKDWHKEELWRHRISYSTISLRWMLKIGLFKIRRTLA